MGYKVAASPAGRALIRAVPLCDMETAFLEWTLCAWPAAHGQGRFPLPPWLRTMCNKSHDCVRHRALSASSPRASQILAWGVNLWRALRRTCIFPQNVCFRMPLSEPFHVWILLQLPSFSIHLYNCLSNHVHLCLSWSAYRSAGHKVGA